MGKNIVKRGKVWHVRATVGGRKINQTLGTGEQALAIPRAKAIIAAAKAGKWETVLGARSKGGLATLGDVEKVYRAAAIRRDLKDKTVTDSLAALRRCLNLSKEAFKAESTALLGKGALDTFVQGRLAAAKTPMQKLRAKRTARTCINQASAIFAAWAMQEYREQGLDLPDLTPFLGYKLPWKASETTVAYRSPPDELVARTKAAGRALKESDPELYVVFLLAYSMAMRSGEIQAAKRDWIQKRDGQWGMDIGVTDAFKSKRGKSRFVPMHDSVREDLLAIVGEREFLLAGDKPTARYDLAIRKFSEWMRSIGWDHETYPKAAHELRKLMGCRWFTEKGPGVAQKLLGHTSVQVTCAYYAEHTGKVAALAPDF